MRTILTKNHSKNIEEAEKTIYNAFKSFEHLFLLDEWNHRGIDSYCFVCTKKRFQEFKDLYAPKPYQVERLEEIFFTPKDSIKAKKHNIKVEGYKIGGVRIIAYSNSEIFKSNRSKHRSLNHTIIVELHGFYQYQKDGEQKPISQEATAVKEYFLKTPKFSKLTALDYAFDFKEKLEINHQEAIAKIPMLEKLNMPHYQKYKTTLYFQKRAPKHGHQPELFSFNNGKLQRVCMYDKQEKNSLDHPITRFEFRILLS